MNTDIIIQARMWSTRLPWKIMLSLAWKPALWHVIERVKKVPNINNIIIATTTNKEDDIIERWCIKNNIKYYRWSSENVLNRYYTTAKKFNSQNIIRITSDCPLIEPKIIEKLITNFDSNAYDYSTICLNRTFPRWFDCEIFTFNALKKANENALTKEEKEHVTPYIIKNLKIFKDNVDKKYYSDARLTLDKLEDYQLISYIYDNFYQTDKIINNLEVLKYLENNQNIKNINVNIKQKDSIW